MYNANNTYFACDVMNEMYAAGDDSNCLSELYSCVRDEPDVLFPVYLNSENKKYTASRDSECFTSLIVDESVVPKGSTRHDQTMEACQGLIEGKCPQFYSEATMSNTTIPKNTGVLLARNYRRRRDAEKTREIVEWRLAENAQRGAGIEIHPPTASNPQKKGHSVRLLSVSETVADAGHDLSTASDTAGSTNGLSRQFCSTDDNVRKVMAAPEVPEPVSGQGTTTDDREVETAVNAQKPRESGECQTTAGSNSGDRQTGDNHINGTISSRRRLTRDTDIDTSNARDAKRAELLTDTCQVVTHNAFELTADEKQITDAQITLLAADADTRSELMRSPDGAAGTATDDETEVIKREPRKQIRRTGDPSQKAETQTVRPIEQWRTENATDISKRIDSNATEANVDTDDLFDMRMQSKKRARTERDDNENRAINYERMKKNRDITSSDVTEKSACKLNETDATDCEETVKTAPDEKTSFRKRTCDKDRSENRRLYKHELGGVYSRNMYGGDERPKRKRNVGLSRLSINTKTLACKMRITSMIKCKIKSRSGTKKEEMRHHTTV